MFDEEKEELRPGTERPGLCCGMVGREEEDGDQGDVLRAEVVRPRLLGMGLERKA